MGNQTGGQTVIVVFDSGIWISAIKYRGVPLEALTFGLEHHDVLTCDELEGEVVRILNRKFAIDPADSRQQLAELLEHAKRILVTGKLSGVCRDPKDDFILECAATGSADRIVTGDKDLLTLDPYGPIRILTPRQYLDDAKHSPRRN
jgi:putative PIN family toxin of toxin-antitoxin system